MEFILNEYLFRVVSKAFQKILVGVPAGAVCGAFIGPIGHRATHEQYHYLYMRYIIVVVFPFSVYIEQ